MSVNKGTAEWCLRHRLIDFLRSPETNCEVFDTVSFKVNNYKNGIMSYLVRL